jgi:hypothetical protein
LKHKKNMNKLLPWMVSYLEHKKAWMNSCHELNPLLIIKKNHEWILGMNGFLPWT